jgi:hypothetical protein
MRKVAVWMLIISLILAFSGGAVAKSKTKTPARTKITKSKSSDVNTAPKRPAGMTEQEVKEAQKRIEAFRSQALERQEELLKELYCLRALSIKEHAVDTTAAVDEMIAKEKQRVDELAMADKQKPQDKIKAGKK